MGSHNHKIHNIAIQETNIIKYPAGITFDNEMTWKSHVDIIVNIILAVMSNDCFCEILNISI